MCILESAGWLTACGATILQAVTGAFVTPPCDLALAGCTLRFRQEVGQKVPAAGTLLSHFLCDLDPLVVLDTKEHLLQPLRGMPPAGPPLRQPSRAFVSAFSLFFTLCAAAGVLR
jgi:hypothetical protein